MKQSQPPLVLISGPCSSPKYSSRTLRQPQLVALVLSSSSNLHPCRDHHQRTTVVISNMDCSLSRGYLEDTLRQEQTQPPNVPGGPFLHTGSPRNPSRGSADLLRNTLPTTNPVSYLQPAPQAHTPQPRYAPQVHMATIHPRAPSASTTLSNSDITDSRIQKRQRLAVHSPPSPSILGQPRPPFPPIYSSGPSQQDAPRSLPRFSAALAHPRSRGRWGQCRRQCTRPRQGPSRIG